MAIDDRAVLQLASRGAVLGLSAHQAVGGLLQAVYFPLLVPPLLLLPLNKNRRG